MTRHPAVNGVRPAHRAGRIDRFAETDRAERTLSWSAFRSTVQHDPTHRMLVAVPAISAKRAEHPELGEAIGLHTEARDQRSLYRAYRGGVVFWTARTGAAALRGAIAARWTSLGAGDSFIGFPITDVRPVAGRDDSEFAHFEGGSIYTTPTGTAVLRGMVRDIWALLGWEGSTLGLPVADVTVTGSGADAAFECRFERGVIRWSAPIGPEVLVDAQLRFEADEDTDARIDRVGAGFAPV